METQLSILKLVILALILIVAKEILELINITRLRKDISNEKKERYEISKYTSLIGNEIKQKLKECKEGIKDDLL